MKIKIFNVKNCCGRTSILLKSDSTISESMVEKFISLGFNSSDVFLKSGILYVSNDDLSLMGSFGATNLQVGCKKSNCEELIKNLESKLEDF